MNVSCCFHWDSTLIQAHYKGLLCCKGKRSKLWTTFNEPGVAAICGHILGKECLSNAYIKAKCGCRGSLRSQGC
jgi:hypothetical protein